MASRNPRTGKTEYKKATRLFRHVADKMVAVSVANKKTGKVVEVLRCTPEHPFFTTKGLVCAGQLGIGTELVTRAGPQAGKSSKTSVLVVASVKSIVLPASGTLVYNLEVEDDHTYFVGDAAGGVWVHNKCAGLHHFWPHSWGNGIPYGNRYLTYLSAAEHTDVHAAFSDFLENATGSRFNSMSGAEWQRLYGRPYLNALLHQFHRAYSNTPQGMALESRLGLSVYDLFKAEYRYALRRGSLIIP